MKPRLLILDRFVRLHRIDENASGEVAPLLAFVRELQRRHGVAVLVIHHTRKGAAGGVRAGVGRSTTSSARAGPRCVSANGHRPQRRGSARRP
jgi:RecA-family ATPase